MKTRALRFFHRGELVQLADPAPTRTVLEWLREDRHCTGTKEGCAEGDCGACTVVLGELVDGALQLRPANACIQFLPTLDGKALFTVEDLATPDALHPVQQAMVDCHGSQCGFCTPGFVMSLWASFQRHRAAGGTPTRQQLADELSGNLCRCTGYRPILDAGERMFGAGNVPSDDRQLQAAAQALQALQNDDPLHTAGGFHAPRTLPEFAALRADKPDARLLAGSTDIGLWVTKQFRPLGELISIGEVAELKTITVADGMLQIGAAASLEDAWSALVQHWPALRDVWLRFASLPIRQAGTMGGNVANGSPIGDAAPVLMALSASIVLQRRQHQRSMPLAGFYVDYMKNRLEAGEFVRALHVPLPVAGEQVRAYKISKRFDSDISAVCAALAVQLRGGTVRSIRVAFGGMAATVRRAAAVEAALLNKRWSQASVEAAQAALAQDFQPLSDMRASAAYRLQVAQNLLQRFWLETRPWEPLPESAVSVFSRSDGGPSA